MLKLETKDFLTGQEISPDELSGLLQLAQELKANRKSDRISKKPLQGKSIALLFDKPSLRTRVSFTVATTELGASPIECVGANMKKETPEDTARVLAGMVDALMVRTFDHRALERMAKSAGIPVINGLTDEHHPCQALADLLTLKEHFGDLKGLKVAYVGDGNNVLHSLLTLMPMAGVDVSFCTPQGYEPTALVVKAAKAHGKAKVICAANPDQAVSGAHAIYTDVWTSMGFEKSALDRKKAFQGFQVNEGLLSKAHKSCTVLHCMPMNRGEEITSQVADHPRSLIFKQSENRLHAQKALLLGMLYER